ncbi:MAG TPA: hypothetical protein VIS76_10865 [Pseudomonadales bacterium]
MLHLLLGSLCALCRRSVAGQDARRQLCEICFADLPWLPTPEIDPPSAAIARQIAPLGYAGPARDWVLASKHDSGLVAARILGTLLAEALIDAYPPGSNRPAHLIPVPLSLRRLLWRGHNQAALIGAPIARALGMTLCRRGARRRRHTSLQPGLDPAARRQNVTHAFRSLRPWHGAEVAIVDDVVTTGATATALAEALLESGAGAVHLWSPTLAPAKS